MKKMIVIIFIPGLFYACKNQGKKEPAITNAAIQLPAQWQQLDSAGAVVLGMRAYIRNGTLHDTDYVVIVNLAAGGGIRILDSIRSGAGSCSPVFNAWQVTTVGNPSFWSLFKSSNSFAMANLQFFNYTGSQTDSDQVCYPIYYNGKYISQGCADGTCGPDQSLPKRIMIITDTISVFTYPDSIPCINYAVPAGAIAAMVGNHPLANRDGSTYTQRTYLAKQGTNLILYTSKYATNVVAYNVLQQEFNVADGDMVMFDGAGSTQMICNGVPYMPSTDKRKVPSAIEIYSPGTVSAKPRH